MHGQTPALVGWAQRARLVCLSPGVLWRSSRQPTVALSTCEAEVSAAALTFQIVEGLKALLLEWDVKLDPPILLVDNKSALVVSEFGGSWRTRYFAVRAARLAEESLHGNIILRYCPTADMGADSLTKMATVRMLQNIRQAMNAILPKIPCQDQTVKDTDRSWWAAMMLSQRASGNGRNSKKVKQAQNQKYSRPITERRYRRRWPTATHSFGPQRYLLDMGHGNLDQEEQSQPQQNRGVQGQVPI